MWVFRAKDKTHYIGTSAPDGTSGSVVVGTLWSDTTNNLLKRCTNTSPITFVSVEGGGGGLSDADYGDITVSGSGTVMTIDNDVVTYAKLQNVSATSRVLGRITAAAGDVEELTGDNVRTIAGLATTDSPMFTALNIGHATDTTLARSGAGDLTVEGNALYRAGGTDVPIADGGTGASSAAAAFDNLAPTTTQGDVIYHNGTDNVRLAAGTVGQALVTGGAGANPSWGDKGSDVIYFGTILAGSNPADATSYYFYSGAVPTTGNPAADSFTTVKVRTAATIRQIDLFIGPQGTNGSAETGSGFIRVNNTTDNTVFNNNLLWNGGSGGTIFQSLTTVSLAAGDFFVFKITTPTFATNPTTVLMVGRIYLTYP